MNTNKRVGKPAADLTGQRFGRLLVIERVENHQSVNRPTWKCLCDCGEEVRIPSSFLKQGRNKSCGCLRQDMVGGRYRTHGKSKTAEYMMFYDARKRAVARGLSFTIEPEHIVIPATCPVLGCELVRNGKRDQAPTLDRIIPEKGYTPENIRVISHRANRLKSDATVAELQAVIAYMTEAANA